jgi:hypothetical protein
MKRVWVIACAAVLLILAAGIYLLKGSHTPIGQPPLIRLDARTLADLQTEFNRNAAEARMILLLSPT